MMVPIGAMEKKEMSDKTSTGSDKVLVNREWGDWKFIPAPDGGIIKAECTRAGIEPGHTERLTKWFQPDIRPHNHPWEIFESTVLEGEITERRFFNPDSYQDFVRSAGDTYTCESHVIHMIIKVKPGTVTHMRMTPNVLKWGSFDKDTFEPVPFNPAFLVAFKAMNAKPE